MKNLLLCLAFLSVVFSAKAQFAVEARLGGSNFLGASLNAAYAIPISGSGNHSVTPSIGIGMLAFDCDGLQYILHGSLNYNYKHWGLGAEMSTFRPLGRQSQYQALDAFVNLLAYPNVNYTFKCQSNWYLRVSGGAYFAYSQRDNSETGKSKLAFEGDVIPGAGLGLGYRF